jgi:hypothetical protein
MSYRSKEKGDRIFGEGKKQRKRSKERRMVLHDKKKGKIGRNKERYDKEKKKILRDEAGSKK